MECILLGTGGMMPMPDRYLSSMAVRLNGTIYLFDAGEGTQLAWKKCRLGLRGLRVIAVTHLHADHCLGLPGMMMLRAQMNDPGPLTILGPPGIEAFVMRNHDSLDFHLNYPVDFVEWSVSQGTSAYEDEHVRILWHPLEHTRFCLGYRWEEKERPGKFDPGSAIALGIPPGPAWGRLQKGETVEASSGEAISPHQVLGRPRRGRHGAYVVDTRPTEGIGVLCNNADIAFIEGMFLPEHSDHAVNKGHLTVVEAAEIARQARVKRAVLIHFSPRYTENDLPGMERIAREYFDRVQVGRDLASYPIQFPE